MLEQAVRPRLKMPTVPALKRRAPGPVRRPVLAKPAATKQRKAAPGKPRTRQTATKLEQPTGKKQRKGACPKCQEAAKSGKSAPCPGCVSPELERPPVPSMKGMAGDAGHPAERQADAIGARIGASLASVPSFGPGPLPAHARSAAEPHLGVSLAGTQLRADRGAQRKAASESALAVTEGRTVSFAAGQFSSSTSAGRALIGHELTHVGQQQAYSVSAQSKSAGCVPAPPVGYPPLIYDRWGHPPRPAQAEVGFAQDRLNVFFSRFDQHRRAASKVNTRAAEEMDTDLASMTPPRSAEAKANGWALDVDCKFGPNTTAATRAFQAAAFPTASRRFAPDGQSKWDGRIGPKTWVGLVGQGPSKPALVFPRPVLKWISATPLGAGAVASHEIKSKNAIFATAAKMSFKAQVEGRPGVSGKVYFVQNVVAVKSHFSACRKLSAADCWANQTDAYSKGGFDTTWPYDRSSKGIKKLPQFSSVEITASDRPGLGYKCAIPPGFPEVVEFCSGEFQMFVMWEPPNSPAEGLGYVPWHWKVLVMWEQEEKWQPGLTKIYKKHILDRVDHPDPMVLGGNPSRYKAVEPPLWKCRPLQRNP